MQKPEMIIFDYGRTLLYQPDFNTSNGNKAIYPYISRNPRNISFEEYDKTIIELFAKIKAERGDIIEIHEHNFLKLAMYVSLFPQLIAGPIVRYTTIEEQLEKREYSFFIEDYSK